MRDGGRSLIDHILTLLDRLSADGGSPDLLEAEAGWTVREQMDGQSLQLACEIMDFMDEMPGGFLIYRADGGEEILYANRALRRIFQCETMEEFRELTGGSFRGMVYPDDLEAVEESIWQQVAASQYDLDYVEYRIVRKDGAVRWIEDYGHFVHTGSVGGIFYVFLADATEKRERMLSERRRLLREREEGRQELRSLTEEYDRERSRLDQEHLRRMNVIEGLGMSYDSIFYVDLNRDTILPYRLSRRSETLFEDHHQGSWSYAACIAAYVDRWVCPEDREAVSRTADPAFLRQRIASGKGCYINYRALDGEEIFYLQLRFVAVGRQEQTGQMVVGCRRVDEEIRREMEQKQLLEEALENARLSIVAKNTFLSNMSHDMRTPLNAIFGFTALARKSLPDTEAARGYLDRIEASSRQLLELIDKVLRLSWSDSKEIRTEDEECSLAAILEEVRRFLLPQAQEKGIDFKLDCTGVRHDTVRGNREKIGQLVMYLANNAVTYTPPGGSVEMIAGESEALPGSCAIYRIAVRDTGIGISEDFLKRIFEPFTRERNTTLSGIHGVGLGLTIAKNIADLLGGTLDVESTVDQGSVFTVTLRLRFLEETPPGGDEEALPAGPPGGGHLLVVEDNEINLEIEVEILESLGFQVDTARDGADAVEKVRSSAPGTYDLILMDIQMPVMNGWQASQAIRALPDRKRAEIPIIALSANVFDSDVRQSLNAGMDAHLAKPIDVPLLLKTIDRIMERRER